MSQITYTNLEFLGLLSVSGKDAVKFLQGQCTQDISKLETAKLTAGAFCTAKGRTVTNVWLVRPTQSNECVHLLCHRTSAALLLAHLKKYIPFFRGTTITDLSDTVTLIGSNQQTSAATPAEPMFTADLPDGRSIAAYAEPIDGLELQPAHQWQQQDVLNRVLWLSADMAEEFIPQNFSLDDLGGISYKKGCYTGQEVIARLHFKGQSKKRLYKLSWPQSANKSDANLYDDKGIAGTVVQSAADGDQVVALAVIKTSSIDKLFADENRQVTVELLN
ncbi:YgfZ/GcvT domain-containing protein [Reinekea marinisedimentorum]|uniref:GCVT N-terminal domain-containing protein n=1 Tax=Reinekea marinisedimentorum TaxID=230495 RepID=A0A4R3I220_9GAMM|nr:folate-binding protein YgfZ [Reinekea marinisedimentorum]TCS39797.1 hypothetical protein BCF53_11282 [Reinekea marinisedimentorum]